MRTERRKAPRHKLFQVTLYVEVPEGISPPHAWNWNGMINPPGVDAVDTPVRHVLSYPVQEGEA